MLDPIVPRNLSTSPTGPGIISGPKWPGMGALGEENDNTTVEFGTSKCLWNLWGVVSFVEDILRNKRTVFSSAANGVNQSCCNEGE